MTKLTAKRWIIDQKRDEMRKYHLDLCFEYANNYYADVENDTVTIRVVEIVKESEKAMQVKAECETTEQRFHEPFILWIPKSQIVAIA
jgi:hypothetical protein